eukprot:COSAG01_NODE_46_length_32080_cov_716.589319_11_plen_36_part_00
MGKVEGAKTINLLLQTIIKLTVFNRTCEFLLAKAR